MTPFAAAKLKKCEHDCEEHMDADVECLECCAAFCDACFAVAHAKGKFKDHTKARVGEGRKTVLCKKHGKEEIKIYCRTCSSEICSLCLLAHTGHSLVPLVDFASSCRRDLEIGAAELSMRAAKLEKLRSQVESCIEQVHFTPEL